MLVEVFAHAGLKQGYVAHAVILADTDAPNEFKDRICWIAASAHRAQGGHAWVIPTAHVVFFDQSSKFAFAHHGVSHIKAGKLNLPRLEYAELIEEPFIQWTMVFVFN